MALHAQRRAGGAIESEKNKSDRQLERCRFRRVRWTHAAARSPSHLHSLGWRVVVVVVRLVVLVPVVTRLDPVEVARLPGAELVVPPVRLAKNETSSACIDGHVRSTRQPNGPLNSKHGMRSCFFYSVAPCAKGDQYTACPVHQGRF